MQFNEVGYTHRPRGGGDSEGLDVDIACINTLVQYNYVHHNEGGGLLICNNKSEINGQERIGDHRGTVVRNNLFYDNGVNDSNVGVFLTISSAVGKTNVHNNTVVLTRRLPNPRIILSADWAKIGKSNDFIFRNNMFVAMEPIAGSFQLSAIVNCVFENNLVFQIGDVGAKLKDRQLRRFDPKLTIPAVVDGYGNGLKFRSAEKRVFEEGVFFEGMPEKDMAGNAVNGKKYIGAFSE
jgi:hypothetical protein